MWQKGQNTCQGLATKEDLVIQQHPRFNIMSRRPTPSLALPPKDRMLRRVFFPGEHIMREGDEPPEWLGVAMQGSFKVEVEDREPCDVCVRR